MMVQMPDTILYLTARQVRLLVDQIDPVAVIEETLVDFAAENAGLAPETALRWRAPDGTMARSLVLPAWAGQQYGCKIINACIGNHARNIPRAQGLIILHDPETAAPICIMEGAQISALRTAAVSVAALRACKRHDLVRTAAVLGCGKQGRTHTELLAASCPDLSRLLIFDQDGSSMRDFVVHCARHHESVEVKTTSDAEQAVRGADVTIAVTTTTTAYVPLEWTNAGSTFLNVSLDDAEASLLLGADHLFVDDWDLVTTDQHRMLGALARADQVTGPAEARKPGARRVDADLPTLVSGGYDRTIEPHHRVVVNPFGMGVHDVALAARVYMAAKAQSVGSHLER
jgi:ornithine cyclodeaminase/alanine dehydrogenase-like protein (mu-crystallin family)